MTSNAISRRDMLKLSGILAVTPTSACSPTITARDSGAPTDVPAILDIGSPDAALDDGGPRDSDAGPGEEGLDAATPAGTLIAHADWSRPGLTPEPLMPGAEWFVYGGAACAQVDDFLRITYPDTTAGGTSAGIALLLDARWDLPEVYAEFQARLPLGPIGPKFYKVHGDGSGTEYANTTYGLGAGDASMYISFGDGTTTGNDVANAIHLDGSNPTWIGRNAGLAVVRLAEPPLTFMLDETWHTFRIRHRYNSGSSADTETNDGLFYLEIDGVVRVDATGLFNRHPLNRRRVNQLTFGDWVQNDGAAAVDFRGLKVSVGGWV